MSNTHVFVAGKYSGRKLSQNYIFWNADKLTVKIRVRSGYVDAFFVLMGRLYTVPCSLEFTELDGRI